jgi:flagellar basal body-associated protein FliL
MTWLLIALFVAAIAGVGYCCLFLSGTHAQREDAREAEEREA